jgi:glutamate-5-semialdehyde dehydrogenase
MAFKKAIHPYPVATMNSSSTDTDRLPLYCGRVAAAAKLASFELAVLPTETKNRWLTESAQRLRSDSATVLAANALDIEAAPGFGLTAAQIDRLRLDESRIEGIASGLEQVARLPDPVGELMESTTQPNGLKVNRVRVPLGVVFFIYESRPNVTADAAAICVKSGNAVILRGGKESSQSSRAIVDLLQDVGQSQGVPEGAIQLVETADRNAVDHFLALGHSIDLVIPRGGEGLIRRVAESATMPVLKHFSGNCHVYVDATADLKMAQRIVVNAKCQRMGVCNAAESLLVHRSVAPELIPPLAELLARHGVEIRGDAAICQLVRSATAATDDDFRTEFLGPVMSVAVVADVDEAVAWINEYGSRHTDAIVAEDEAVIDRFVNAVDTAAVMVNASTRFHDGGEFGLGAEIGISTDKFHARGPCGLRELTSYKYVVRGSGQIRE